MKLQRTIEIVGTWLEKSKNPCIMCSFGKDSLALLHIIRTHFCELPVVFYQEPCEPQKYEFANEVERKWKLRVHRPTPIKVGLQQVGDVVEFVNSYPVGVNTANLALNRVEPNETNCLCGVVDFLLKPTAKSTYPWDVTFIGHKSCDEDPSYEKLTLTSDFFESPGNTTSVFPLRDWSHEDVWNYVEANDVPIHLARYEKVDGKWRVKKDHTYNPDTFPFCAKCLLSVDKVICPKFKREVNGLRNQIEISKPFIPSYVEN